MILKQITRKIKQSIPLVTAVTVLVVASLISTAKADEINPGLFSTDSKPYGLAFPQWSEKWWKWMISIPQPQNPLNDNTGENCGNGQNDSHVWFMTGTGSGTVVRSCNVPSSKAILIQPVGNECSYAENPSLRTESELRNCAITGDQTTTKYISIDGRNVQNLERYAVQTPLFDLTLPQNNIFGAPAGPTKSVGHAYMIFLQPLKVGKHEIRFGQTTVNPDTGITNFAYDVTYHLTVK